MLWRKEKTAFKRHLHFLSLALIYRNKREDRSGAPQHTGDLFPSEASTQGGSNSVLPAATLPRHGLSVQDRPCCASYRVRTGRKQSKPNLKMNHLQPRALLWAVLCKLGSYMMPCLT